MEATEVDAKSISKDTESPESDQPSSEESASLKTKSQIGCDGPATVKARTSREDKLKKKDDKSVEHVLKALNSLNTTEEKLAAMCKKYADIFDENRKLQLALKQSEKRNGVLQREKELLQTDHTKSIMTRSRLENLCRALQRQNKAIKDESLSKIREEEEKRKEVSAKFQSTFSEINQMMQENTDKNTKLRDDNLDMNARLKSVCEQYELREQEVDRISKQMQLESQLAEAKLAKAKMEMAAERELFIREKQQLLVEVTQYQARCQDFQTNEINLRKQISLYNEKYDEFQRALAKSNEVFGGFKVEMDKMSKKILKLEKETITWKQRWENSHQALLSMADDKQKTDQELGLVNRKLGALQGLCRTLQTERTSMLAKLKEAGIKNDDQTPSLTNGDVSTDVEAAKEQEQPTTVNSRNKKDVPLKPTPSAAPSDVKQANNQQNSNVKCLKNSSKKCEKEKSNSSVEEKKSSDSPVEAKVVGQLEAASADGKSEVLPANNGSLSPGDSQVEQKTDIVSKGSVVCSDSVDKSQEPGSDSVDKSQAPGSLVEKDSVGLKKEPAELLVDPTKSNTDSKEVSVDTKKLPVDSAQVSADSKKLSVDSTQVSADSKQVIPDSKKLSVDSTQLSADSKQVSVDSTQVSAVSADCKKVSADSVQVSEISADSEKVSADSKKVPADSKQVTAKPKANACKKTSQVTSPAKGDPVCAKESTPTSPKASDSEPSLPETDKKEVVNQCLSSGDKTATTPKAANCETKKAKESKKKKK